MPDYDDTEAAATRRQALVTVDKIQEALEDENDQEAADGTLRLSQHVGDLLEIDHGD